MKKRLNRRRALGPSREELLEAMAEVEARIEEVLPEPLPPVWHAAMAEVMTSIEEVLPELPASHPLYLYYHGVERGDAERAIREAASHHQENEVQQEQLEKFADALEERGFFARRYAAGLIELFRAAKSLHHHCCHLDLRNQARALDMPIVEFVRAYAEVNPGLNKFSSHPCVRRRRRAPASHGKKQEG